MKLRLVPDEYYALTMSVLDRDHWKCRSCGSRNALHVHHIIFRSQQGQDEAWNLITLCSACHKGIHVDVCKGIMGLSIVLPADANAEVKFVRAVGWKP